ncbi:hypothetical protein LINPERHAP1_LOCUS9490, partial [Linum perenne]
CLLGQKHASVVPGARSSARGWLSARPLSILAKPSAFFLGHISWNALKGSSMAGTGLGLMVLGLRSSLGTRPSSRLAPGPVF